jgi:hypothetical protein
MKAAEESLKKAKEAMKKRWEKNRPTPKEFKENDLVVVTAHHLPSNSPSAKLDQKWRGPFRVIKKVGEGAYHLDLPPTWKGERVFNKSHIKRFHLPAFRCQEELPVHPELTLVDEGRKEYEVWEILAERGTGRRIEYLVRWEGYRPRVTRGSPSKILTTQKEP